MSSNPEAIDIVLPCYNPHAGWAQRVAESFRIIQQMLPHIQLRIILVNDGSEKNITPGDIEFLQREIPGFEIISNEVNRGKGYALRKGVAASTAPLCIYTDIDFPYKEEMVSALAQLLLHQSCDIAVGVRNYHYYDKAPYIRRVISKWLRRLIRVFLKIQITDTQGGLKGFNRKGREVFLQTNIDRYLFDLQFIYLASRKPDLKMTPVEVELKNDIVFSRMNSRILLHESVNFIKILFQ